MTSIGDIPITQAITEKDALLGGNGEQQQGHAGGHGLTKMLVRYAECLRQLEVAVAAQEAPLQPAEAKGLFSPMGPHSASDA